MLFTRWSPTLTPTARTRGSALRRPSRWKQPEVLCPQPPPTQLWQRLCLQPPRDAWVRAKYYVYHTAYCSSARSHSMLFWDRALLCGIDSHIPSANAGTGGATEGSGEQDGTCRTAANSKGGQQGRHAPRLDSAAAASEDAGVSQKTAPTLPAATAKGGKQGGKKRAAADRAQHPGKRRKLAEAAGQLGQPGVDSVRAEQEPSAEGTQAPLPAGGPEPEVAVPAHPGGRVMRARVSKGVWWAGTMGPPGPQAAPSALGSDTDMAEAPGPVMAAGVAEQPEARAGQRLNKGKSRAAAPKEEAASAVGTPDMRPKPAKPAALKQGQRRAAHAPAHQEMGSRVEQEGAGEEEAAVQGMRPLLPRVSSRHMVQDTGADTAGHLQPPESQPGEQPAASEAHEEAAGAHTNSHEVEIVMMYDMLSHNWQVSGLQLGPQWDCLCCRHRRPWACRGVWRQRADSWTACTFPGAVPTVSNPPMRLPCSRDWPTSPALCANGTGVG